MQPPANFRPVTITTGIRAASLRDPGKVALTCAGRSLDYAALVDRIGRVAAAVAARGAGPGTVVAVVAPNCLEYVELVSGIAEAGAAAATVNPKLTPPELRMVLEDCDARGVFCTPATEAAVREATAGSDRWITVLGPEYDAMLGASRAATPRTVAEWDPFALVYTSGTTGRPRGVVLPHRSRVMTFFAMAAEYGCYGPDDHYLALAPLFHGAGYAFAHAALFFGGSCEVLESFDPEEVLDRIQRTRPAGTFMVPTHFHAIFALPPTVLDARRGNVLRGLVSNAAALPQRTKELIVDYFGTGVLHETYGSTEAGIVTNLRPADQLRKIGCVGRAFGQNRVALLDADSAPVPPGVVGELFSDSPYLFNGYHGLPDATAASMRDGWFSAGDLARQDDEGFIYLVDRKKDMYVSGGVNVYPREAEEALFRAPGVRECAVVGVPDDYWGEAGRAFVVAQPGVVLDPEALLRHCRASLAGFKVPKTVELLDRLPRNAAGKVLKADLKAIP